MDSWFIRGKKAIQKKHEFPEEVGRLLEKEKSEC